jgi:prepilin-type N-terminal cleavage/methylation domain-containing protein
MSQPSKRRGLTLIEILVVLSLVGVMAAMSGGVFSGVLDYFKGRRSAETMMWELRKLQQKARARGNTPAVFGIKFYSGRVLAGRVEPSGFSYLPYGPLAAEPAAVTVGALSANEQSLLVAMEPSSRLVADGTVANPVDMPFPSRIQFQRDPVSGDYRPDLGSPARVDLFVTNVGTFRITIEGRSLVAARFIGL